MTVHQTNIMEATPVAAPSLPAIHASQFQSPAALMMQAVASGMDVATVEKMMDLQARFEADQARRAYVSDFALFAAERPTVSKNKTVGFGSKREGAASTNYKHETLDNLVDTVGPVLAKFGFSHTWNTVQDGPKVHVTCTLTHRLGHKESVSMFAAPDGTGNKNPIQQVASTVTFLQRYTFRAVTGVATADEYDDDALGHGGETAQPHLSKFVQDWIAYANSVRNDPQEFRKACANGRAEIGKVRDSVGLKHFNMSVGDQK